MTIPRTPAAEPIRSAGRSAALVSVITLASRIMGLVRTLVVTGILGITFLGNTYSTANALPNLLFEIIAGGAVAAALLPALAGAAALGDARQVQQTASAVLNRALLAMTPVVLAGMLLREPLMRALTSAVEDPGVRAAEIKIGASLLLMFLPQLWLYVFGVVLTGVLHTYHRFCAPALAPLLSSIVVTGTYVLYGAVEGPDANRLESVSETGLLILGLGTTLGVAVLSLSLVPPAVRAGFAWRRVLAIPPQARAKLRALTGPAVVTVGIQQVFLAGVLVLANKVAGGVVAYQLAFTTLLVFWAIFPLPVATTLFPGLAAAASDKSEFAQRSAQAGTRVMTIVLGAAALMFALAGPIAGVVIELGAGGSEGQGQEMIALTIAAFGPGLVGYGLYALYTRAAYASSDGRSPAVAATIGFGAGLALNAVAAGFLEGPEMIAALAGGFSIGILLAAITLILSFRRHAGKAAVAGLGGAFLRGLGAAVPAAAAGIAISGVISVGSLPMSIVRSGLVGLSVTAVFVLALLTMGDREVRSLLRGLRRTPVKTA